MKTAAFDNPDAPTAYLPVLKNKPIPWNDSISSNVNVIGGKIREIGEHAPATRIPAVLVAGEQPQPQPRHHHKSEEGRAELALKLKGNDANSKQQLQQQQKVLPEWVNDCSLGNDRDKMKSRVPLQRRQPKKDKDKELNTNTEVEGGNEIDDKISPRPGAAAAIKAKQHQVYPVLTDDMSASKKITMNIIAKVRNKNKNEVEAEKPLSAMEIKLLRR